MGAPRCRRLSSSNKKKQESPGVPLLNAQAFDQKLYFIAKVA